MDDLDDAIVEDTCHCDLCGGSFVLGGTGGYVIIDTGTTSPIERSWSRGLRRPSAGTLGGQLKLCEYCSQRVHDAYRENLREAGICEHGVNDGEYCEDCNREYKRARRAAEKSDS